MFKSGKTGYRMALIVIGTIITALGTAMSIGAGFGGGTMPVLWQGLCLQLGLSIGAASMLVSLVLVGIVLLISPRQLQLGTIVHMAVYSLFLDLFDRLTYRTGAVAADLLVMLVGVAIFSVGIGLYASADLGRGPYEGVCFALQQKMGWKLGRVRMVGDGILVAAGLLMGGTVGLCTIAILLLSGPMIQKTVELLGELSWFRHTFVSQ